MLCSVEIRDDIYLTAEAAPECGEDFCDSCGDCLVCDMSGLCYGHGGVDPEAGHSWIQYIDDSEHCARLQGLAMGRMYAEDDAFQMELHPSFTLKGTQTGRMSGGPPYPQGNGPHADPREEETDGS